MSVSTTVQVQIGDLLAHCTVEVVVDVPSSAILLPEINNFCQKVTGAVINAANEVRAEHAAAKAVIKQSPAHEPAGLLEQPGIEGDEPLPRITDGDSKELQGTQSTGAAIRYNDTAGEPKYLSFDALSRMACQATSDPAQVRQDYHDYLKRSRHDSMEPEASIPKAKRPKIDDIEARNPLPLADNPPEAGKAGKRGKKKKNRFRPNKGKNKQKFWEKQQMQDSYGAGGYQDSYYPPATYAPSAYSQPTYPPTTYSMPTYAAPYAYSPYRETPYPGAATPATSYSAPPEASYPTASHVAAASTVPPYPQTLFSAPAPGMQLSN